MRHSFPLTVCLKNLHGLLGLMKQTRLILGFFAPLSYLCLSFIATESLLLYKYLYRYHICLWKWWRFTITRLVRCSFKVVVLFSRHRAVLINEFIIAHHLVWWWIYHAKCEFLLMHSKDCIESNVFLWYRASIWLPDCIQHVWYWWRSTSW